MGVPKRKRSHARRDKRFANKGLKTCAGAVCQNCKTARRAHAACPNCGFYKGVKVTETKTERGMKRDEIRKAKAQRQKGGETQGQQE